VNCQLDDLHSDRLVLRRWRVEDVDALTSAITESLEHLRPWMPWIAFEPSSRDERLALIRQWSHDWEHGGDMVVGAFLGELAVGGAGLHRRLGPDSLEIGYWVHSDHLRRGYAVEIAEALTTAAFTLDGIDRVEIHIDEANTRSAGVPLALGFALAGSAPDTAVAPGESGIECRWTMTREDWVSAERPGRSVGESGAGE